MGQLAGRTIGIDLGTTNSAMAFLEDERPEIIPNSEGDRTTPSVVAFRNGNRIVGKVALNQRVANPENTIYSVKRFIGRTASELSKEDRRGLAFQMGRDSKDRPVVIVDEEGNGSKRPLLPEVISAAILSKLKDDASDYLGERVTDAVITVPAYFNDAQRQATKDAGRIAGLNVRRIVNEPTAAALAYGYGRGITEDRKVLVFDLGGGTLDISILDVSSDFIEVISTAGDNRLGGDLWDAALCSSIERRFEHEHGVDLSADLKTHSRVLEAARNAKHELSHATSTTISLPFIAPGPLNLSYEITRGDFEKLTKGLLDRCRGPIAKAMDAGGSYGRISFDEIDEVLLVGGSTRMPAVQKLVRKVTGKDPEMTVNPDEAVALGAAVQAGLLDGTCNDIVLADVTSMSLGLRSFDVGEDVPHVERMIERNSTLPTRATKTFTTRTDNQDSIEIVLIQGEDPLPDDPGNKVIGITSLEGIPLMPAGQPQVEITVGYDLDGTITIEATEQSRGLHMKVRLKKTTRLTTSDVKLLAAAELRRK